MSRRILLVEDNSFKRTRIVDYVRSVNSEVHLDVANSFTSGSQALIENHYALVILDISLPTYDRQGSESGGRFRTLGGREIARRLVRAGASSTILFMSQFDSFSDKGTFYTFESLSKELKEECGEKFFGMVFYDSSQSLWKDAISRAIGSLPL